MSILKKVIYRNEFFLCLVLFILVIIINSILLEPVYRNGLTNDAWVMLYKAKFLGMNFFSKINLIIQQFEPHYTNQAIYITFLNILFDTHFEFYYRFSVFLKTLSSLSIFLALFIITKNRLLAFLAAIIYSISYTSAGALEFVMVGIEYLGVIFLSVFSISYYFLLKKFSITSLVLSSILLSFTFLSAPIRVFPVFLIILLIELFKIKKGIRQGLTRIFVLFLPIFLLMILYNLYKFFDPVYTSNSVAIFNTFLDGNFYNLLAPISGLGYSFIPFLRLIPYDLWTPVNQYGVVIAARYQIGLGIYILIISIVSFVYWYKRQRQNIFLFILSISPFIFLVFIGGPWILLGKYLEVNRVSRYLVIPGISTSLFLASFLVLMYKNLSAKYKQISIISISVFIFSLLLISKAEISYRFNLNLLQGFDIRAQEIIQNKFLSRIPLDTNVLVYFQEPEKYAPDITYWKIALDILDIHHWGPYRITNKGFIYDQCIEATSDFTKLNKIAVQKNGRKGFFYEADCSLHRKLAARIQNKKYTEDNFFPAENFYAFTFNKRGEIIEITEDVLKELNFKSSD